MTTDQMIVEVLIQLSIGLITLFVVGFMITCLITEIINLIRRYVKWP